MKKHIMILGILIMLVTVGLSGCDEEQPIDLSPKITLNGWYYVFDHYVDKIFNNSKIAEQERHLLWFLPHEGSRTLRIIVHKDSPGGIRVLLGNDEDAFLYTIDTPANTFDTGEFTLEPVSPFLTNYICSYIGDVNVTILERFDNFKTNLGWDFVKYEGD